jgi:site-specific recombinase XerD
MARGKGRETYRKVITSPELIEQINPKNKMLVDRFLKNFATKRSPNSVVSYKSNLNIFMCWNLLYNENEFFVELKKFNLLDFFDFCCTELKWNSNRYAQMHSCLSSFSTFIENIYDEKYPMFRNLLPKIEKLPKEAVRKKSVFKKEELDYLMECLGKQEKIQEQCLLALIMSSGSRASELLRFTTDMIDENHVAFDGLFLETTEDIRVKGRGVNGKYIPRYLIKDIFLPYYKKWLPIRNQIMKETGKSHNFIFIRSDGEPAQLSTIRSWMEKWDNVLDKHWYPHAGRHFWCSYLLSIGLEKQLVQELQAWSSDALVDIYNDNTAKDMKWKGLEKLKAALEQELLKEELDEIENGDMDE